MRGQPSSYDENFGHGAILCDRLENILKNADFLPKGVGKIYGVPGPGFRTGGADTFFGFEKRGANTFFGF